MTVTEPSLGDIIRGQSIIYQMAEEDVMTYLSARKWLVTNTIAVYHGVLEEVEGSVIESIPYRQALSTINRILEQHFEKEGLFFKNSGAL